jgi:hypothetical protein
VLSMCAYDLCKLDVCEMLKFKIIIQEKKKHSRNLLLHLFPVFLEFLLINKPEVIVL